MVRLIALGPHRDTNTAGSRLIDQHFHAPFAAEEFVVALFGFENRRNKFMFRRWRQ